MESCKIDYDGHDYVFYDRKHFKHFRSNPQLDNYADVSAFQIFSSMFEHVWDACLERLRHFS